MCSFRTATMVGVCTIVYGFVDIMDLTGPYGRHRYEGESAWSNFLYLSAPYGVSEISCPGSRVTLISGVGAYQKPERSGCVCAVAVDPAVNVPNTTAIAKTDTKVSFIILNLAFMGDYCTLNFSLGFRICIPNPSHHRQAPDA